ncbi:translation initiation factor eIF-1/SUI1-like protein [Thiovulum sp. ES]|nr:translation initiation factor eIF-1/SUI1-like protein [Thiovulum sp. ES]
MEFDPSKLFNGRDFSDRDFDSEMKKKILSREKHNLKISLEKRKHKKVTVVGEFFILEKERKELLKNLKKKVSTGGTERENFLEFQGDVREKVKSELEKLGFNF